MKDYLDPDEREEFDRIRGLPCETGSDTEWLVDQLDRAATDATEMLAALKACVDRLERIDGQSPALLAAREAIRKADPLPD